MKTPQFIRRAIGESAMLKLAEARAEYAYSKMKYQCDEGLITIFEELLGDKRDGFYLDVGSNDGRTASNTWHLERSLNWRGILVEPVLHLYFESRKLRQANNVFVNAACVDPSFSDPCLKMIYAGLMTVSPDQSSFDASSHAAAGSHFISAHETTEIIYVPASAVVTHEYFTGANVGVTFGTALSAFCVTTGGTAGTTSPSAKYLPQL